MKQKGITESKALKRTKNMNDPWSEKQADKYYQMLLDNFTEIAENPKIGKNYSGIANHRFGLKAGRHIIFYRKPDI